MAAALLSSALFAALLLSPPGAGADGVTWRKCKTRNYGARVLEASLDSNATAMWIRQCHLTEVKSGDFDGLPNLVTISLSSNSIAHVDPAAFRTLPKLRWLSLDDNDLREVPVFDEHSYCPSLTYLYLSRNRITEIKHQRTFSGCAELQHLHIVNNVIQYIHPDVFRPLSKLKILHIGNNKITAIPENLFIKNNKLDVLDLNDNKISYLPSDFVSKLRSAGAPLHRFNFQGNPWHCPCLLELLADVKRADVEYTYSWLTGTEPECVYGEEQNVCRRVANNANCQLFSVYIFLLLIWLQIKVN